MKKHWYLLAMVVVNFSLTINAAETSKDNLLVTTVSRMVERSASTQYNHSMIVSFNDLTWLPSSCSGADGVILSSSDPFAFSVALSALDSSKPVFARVESTQVTGGYCELVQISIRSQ